MAGASEQTPLQPEKEESGLGGCCCCRSVAQIRFAFLETNRQHVLRLAHCICAFSLLLMAVGFVGAYSTGDVLSYLGWLQVHGPHGRGFAGVRHVCTPSKDGSKHWECVEWSEFDCGARNAQAGSCDLCKTQSMSLVVSVFIGCYTYYAFYKKTDARLTCWDSCIACAISHPWHYHTHRQFECLHRHAGETGDCRCTIYPAEAGPNACEFPCQDVPFVA